MISNWQILASVSLVAVLTSVGGIYIAVRQPQWYRLERIWLLLAVGTGLLFGVAFLEFLPHALETPNPLAPPLIIAGILFILVMETFISPRLNFMEGQHCDHDHAHDHHHKAHPEHEHQHHMISHQAACSAVGCLIICSFFDGFSIKSAFAIDLHTGWMTSFGLFFHVLPDGVLAASIAMAGGMNRKNTINVVIVTGGALIVGALAAGIMGSLLPLHQVVLPFATGILIYVSLIHLLPAGMKHPKGIWWILAGSVLFWLNHIFLHH